VGRKGVGTGRRSGKQREGEEEAEGEGGSDDKEKTIKTNH